MSLVAGQVLAQGGPRLIAAAIAFVGTLRFIKWAAPFVFERLDARADRIDKRELEIQRRFNLRLRHVELELDRYRRATMALVNALAKKDPANPVLTEVATILSSAMPMVPEDPELDQLLARAGDAVETNQGGARQ